MRKYYVVGLVVLIAVGCNKNNDNSTLSIVEYEKKYDDKDGVVVEKAKNLEENKMYELKDKYRDSLPIFPFSNANLNIFDSYPKDAKGIPMLKYETVVDYYPITYTRAALSNYQNYIETKNPKSKEQFLEIVGFIENNIVNKKDFSVLTTPILVNNYSLNKDWASAMSQGFGIGVMIQAYFVTKDEKYLRLSERMVRSFDYSIEEGGVQSNWDGFPFYEEYADPKSHVLNGFIFSLGGLYYSYQTTGNQDAYRLFEQGINSLKAKINRYDASFTSYYNMLIEGGVAKYASAIGDDPDHYHELVVYQLLTLFNWTGEEVFKEYAHKFLKSDTGEVTDFYNQNKYKSISASHSIDSDKFGVNHVNDELWSWGNYWSTNKVGSELVFEFWGETKDIEGIVFYSTSNNTLPVDYDIYVFKNEWIKVCNSKEIYKKDSNWYKTDSYETFIVTNYFPNSTEGTKLKVVFNSLGSGDAITLRECNILFDRTHELEMISESSKRYLIK